MKSPINQQAKAGPQLSMPSKGGFLAPYAVHPYHSGELLLLWGSGYSPVTKRILLFSFKANLEILEEASNWVIDGTFKVAPLVLSYPLRWWLSMLY